MTLLSVDIPLAFIVNVSDVTNVKQNGISMNPSNWGFDISSKILELNATWSSVSEFEIIYGENEIKNT